MLWGWFDSADKNFPPPLDIHLVTTLFAMVDPLLTAIAPSTPSLWNGAIAQRLGLAPSPNHTTAGATNPHLHPYLILVQSSPHPHLHPHLILTSSSPLSSPHPHLILTSSSPHPHPILASSSPNDADHHTTAGLLNIARRTKNLTFGSAKHGFDEPLLGLSCTVLGSLLRS